MENMRYKYEIIIFIASVTVMPFFAIAVSVEYEQLKLEADLHCEKVGCVWDGIEKTALYEMGLKTDLTYSEYETILNLK